MPGNWLCRAGRWSWWQDQRERLALLREELVAASPGIDVRCVPLDLTAPDAPFKLFQQTQADGLDIALLINNAGFGAFGGFLETDRERLRRMLDLNIAAVVELAHLYLQPMCRQSASQRSGGGIINIASVAGFLPLPYSAVYAATKAFVLSFSYALFEEARQHGVHVMVVNPGSTATSFFEVAGESPYSDPSRMQTAGEVVGESLRAFARGRRSVTTGALNRAMVLVTGLIPRSWITAVVGRGIRRLRAREKTATSSAR